jgi:hypothetical protein
MHTRTTVGAYPITYVDALRTANGAYAQLMLLGDCCTRYSILKENYYRGALRSAQLMHYAQFV